MKHSAIRNICDALCSLCALDIIDDEYCRGRDETLEMTCQKLAAAKSLPFPCFGNAYDDAEQERIDMAVEDAIAEIKVELTGMLLLLVFGHGCLLGYQGLV